MKVLFIRSGNNGIDPITQNQGDSLIKSGLIIKYFDIVGKGISGYLKNISRLREFVMKEEPDVLHAHYALSGILTILASNRKPVIVSLMGSEINNTSKVLNLVIRSLVMYRWNATIVKSKGMKKKLGIDKVHIIPNGVDMHLFYPIQKSLALKILCWDNQKKHILFGSNTLRPEKNHELFLKSVDRIISFHPEMEIRYLDGIQRENVFLYYCASDVLVLTSNYEGSPNVIKEAMACNCPIVSTDVGDVREIISGTEGCFITSFDPSDVCDKINSALNFGSRTTGRNKISELSSELVAKKLINIYVGIMDASR